jgi:hypothetical protein
MTFPAPLPRYNRGGFLETVEIWDIHANMRFIDLIQHEYSQSIPEGIEKHKITDVPLIPAVKYMGQLFDHMGSVIIGEWYMVGEYKTEKLRSNSVGGRLGDIRGRPNQADLEEIAEKVKDVLSSIGGKEGEF